MFSSHVCSIIFVSVGLCTHAFQCRTLQQRTSFRWPISVTPNNVDNDINSGRSTISSSRRREFAINGAVTLISSLLIPSFSAAAAVEQQIDEQLIDVYFGCGCFWHVQHEFVQAERTILGRKDDEITSRAGYAGGLSGSDEQGRVCYHNAANIADYGKFGHAEIVSLRIPTSKFSDFAVEYCKLFKNGMRPDQFGDRGPEYRNLVGLKGGSRNPLAQELVQASQKTGDELDFAVGKGNDNDIARLVWIMDSEKFPSYKAEQYHQFHDGFNFGENYPNSYNSLAQKFSKTANEDFGICPNGLIGVGFGGL